MGRNMGDDSANSIAQGARHKYLRGMSRRIAFGVVP